MNNSIKAELKAHVLNLINDGVLTDDNQDDWHFHAFNEDYYIIGYYQASEWLKQQNIDAFEAISTVVEYEQDNFGECHTKTDNSESVVNMLVYIMGEELLNDIQADNVKELEAACQ